MFFFFFLFFLGLILASSLLFFPFFFLLYFRSFVIVVFLHGNCFGVGICFALWSEYSISIINFAIAKEEIGTFVLLLFSEGTLIII